MSEKIIKQDDINHFLMAIVGCLAIGLFGAFVVTFDGPGWISFIAFTFALLFLISIILFLFIYAIIVAIQDKAKHSLILLTCALLLPVSFFGSIVLLDELNLTESYASESNHIRPVDSDLGEGIVIAFNENISREEIHEFEQAVLRNEIPEPNGKTLDFADGVCSIFYPDTGFKNKIADVRFCNDADAKQKKSVKDKVNASKIIHKVFEELQRKDIKNLPLEKAKVEPRGNVKDAKTGGYDEVSN